LASPINPAVEAVAEWEEVAAEWEEVSAADASNLKWVKVLLITLW
jgi:hypothetical protein